MRNGERGESFWETFGTFLIIFLVLFVVDFAVFPPLLGSISASALRDLFAFLDRGANRQLCSGNSQTPLRYDPAHPLSLLLIPFPPGALLLTHSTISLWNNVAGRRYGPCSHSNESPRPTRLSRRAGCPAESCSRSAMTPGRANL